MSVRLGTATSAMITSAWGYAWQAVRQAVRDGAGSCTRLDAGHAHTGAVEVGAHGKREVVDKRLGRAVHIVHR